jgi:HSP20 family molecular chaperone IbpA
VREHGRCIVNVEVADAYRESTEIGVDVAGECLTIRVNGSRADAATARRLASEWATVPVSPPLGDGEALDLDGITASYDHGTLRIGIPVVRRPVPRRIAVTTDSSLHADAVTPVSFNAVAPSSLRR